jgi:hypothetical protein
MVDSFKKFCQTFGAGAMGGVVSALVFIMLYEAKVIDTLGVTYRPGLYMTISNAGFNSRAVWFYEAVVLYGVFATVFQLPWLKGSQIQQAGIAMLVPTIFQLVYVFPVNGFGIFGIGLGNFTFVIVLLLSFVWALVAASFVPQGK